MSNQRHQGTGADTARSNNGHHAGDAHTPRPGDPVQAVESLAGQIESTQAVLRELLEDSLRLVQATQRGLTNGVDTGGLVAEDDADLAPAALRRLDSVHEALRRMESMLHQQSNPSGRLRFAGSAFQEQPLVDALLHAAETTRQAVQGRRITVTIDCSPRLVLLPAGPVYAVVSNATCNAVESVVVGGRVDVFAELLTRHIEQPTVQIDVFDTGAGLGPEGIAKAFKPGYSTKRDGVGTGLAVCKDIVGTLGGRVYLQSLTEDPDAAVLDAADTAPRRTGPGARFTARFPVQALTANGKTL